MLFNKPSSELGPGCCQSHAVSADDDLPMKGNFLRLRVAGQSAGVVAGVVGILAVVLLALSSFSSVVVVMATAVLAATSSVSTPL